MSGFDPLEGMEQATDLVRPIEVDPRGLASTRDTEMWVGERVELARALARQMGAVQDKLAALPKDKEAARRQVIRGKMVEIYGMPNPTRMDPTRFQAAVMVGIGVSVPESAMALGINPVDIYQGWDDDFKAVIRHWRGITLEEYFSIIIRSYDELLVTVTDPEILIKILKELYNMASDTEEGRHWKKEFELREREVLAREQDADSFAHQVGLGELPEGALEVIDADFEVLEVEDDG